MGEDSWLEMAYEDANGSHYDQADEYDRVEIDHQTVEEQEDEGNNCERCGTEIDIWSLFCDNCKEYDDGE